MSMEPIASYWRCDKAGDFVILDRTTGKLVSRLAVSDQQGIFTTVSTLKGTFACPNHGGG